MGVEEFSRAYAATGGIYCAHIDLVASPIYIYCTEEQQTKYLVPLNQGKYLGAFGLTEPNAGTDASNQQTTSVLDGRPLFSQRLGRVAGASRGAVDAAAGFPPLIRSRSDREDSSPKALYCLRNFRSYSTHGGYVKFWDNRSC